MKINNAKNKPIVLYGLHFSPGVAEYQEPGKSPYRILINEDVAKKMDATFEGCPIYVEHVDEVNLETLQEDADGYVMQSFYNKLDGKHWVKMILVSDAAQEAYRKGYQLSNAYVPKAFRAGGQWHGVTYEKEVMDGEYEHLALVRDPRYAESMILTPEEFTEYNNKKELDLKRLSNAKENPSMKLSFFRRTRVENSKEVDFENLEVELPKSKQVVTLSKCIEGYDAIQNMAGYAAPEHMVKLNDKEECSVKDLLERHNNLEKELTTMKEKNAGGDGEHADMESMDNEEIGEEMSDEELGVEPGADLTKKNADDEKGKKKKNARPVRNSDEDLDDGEELPVAAKSGDRDPAHFRRLKNAAERANREEPPTVLLTSDKVERGRQRYGSGN